ncbi:MAG: phosphotriesterase family protein [Dehalococcoidia bacterium]
MATVETVLGPIKAEQLGFTLSHEHVLTSSAGIAHTYPELLGDMAANLREAAQELALTFAGGVRSIVDVTTLDLGRDVHFLADASRGSGVQIVCCTGIWRDIPRVLTSRSPDEIAALFVREIEVGIEGSGIKAGVIKVANDAEGVTEAGERILRAAARTSLRTGVPISTHSYAPGRVGEQQWAIFREEGVPPEKVYIGHSNDTTDIEYLTGLLQQGLWLGLDRYPGGRSVGPGWEERTEALARLIKSGYAGQLMLGHDWSAVSGTNLQSEAQRRAYNPDSYLFISRKVLPRLLDLGVEDREIRTMMVENPARFLGR